MCFCNTVCVEPESVTCSGKASSSKRTGTTSENLRIQTRRGKAMPSTQVCSVRECCFFMSTHSVRVAVPWLLHLPLSCNAHCTALRFLACCTSIYEVRYSRLQANFIPSHRSSELAGWMLYCWFRKAFPASAIPLYNSV